MSRPYTHLSKALQPLLDRADALDGQERRTWLSDLRRDCPTVAQALDRVLSPRSTMDHVTTDRLADTEPMHALDMLGLRR